MLPEASNAAGWENTHQVPARCPSVWHRAAALGKRFARHRVLITGRKRNFLQRRSSEEQILKVSSCLAIGEAARP